MGLRHLARSCAAAGAAASILTLALAAGAAAGEPAGQASDLILVDGRVFTADPDQPWAEAVAIRGDRIVAVGTSATISRQFAPANGTSTRIIPLGGRLVVPGINDAHTHLNTEPEGAQIEGLSDDPSWDEVLSAVATAAQATPVDRWIYGTIGARVLDDARVDRAAIDAVAAQHAVRLTCWSGHGVIANSEALRRAGIRDDEPDPPGGFYVRRPGTKILTGLAHEYAGFALTAGAAVPRDKTLADVRTFDEQARELGITTLQMMSVDAWARDPVPFLAEAGTRVRWRLMDFTRAPPADWAPNASPPVRGDDARVYASGTKWILDGTPVERLMWVDDPYVDRPAARGQMNFPSESLRPALTRALAAGEPLLLHAGGDATIDAVFDAMDATGGPTAWRAQRLRIEHGDMLTPDRFERARALGVVLVQNPSHFMIREIMETRLGAARSARIQVVNSALAAGIPLALGSDGPLSPWLNLLFATTHANNPTEALSREEALIAYTRGSAFAEFTESSKGMLRAGMLADLAVLSQDVLTVAAADLPATTSVLTLVGGQIVHDAGVVPSTAGR